MYGLCCPVIYCIIFIFSTVHQCIVTATLSYLWSGLCFRHQRVLIKGVCHEFGFDFVEIFDHKVVSHYCTTGCNGV